MLTQAVSLPSASAGYPGTFDRFETTWSKCAMRLLRRDKWNAVLHGLRVKHKDSHANFDTGLSQPQFAEALRRRGVEIGRQFPTYTNCARITIGLLAENSVVPQVAAPEHAPAHGRSYRTGDECYAALYNHLRSFQNAGDTVRHARHHTRSAGVQVMDALIRPVVELRRVHAKDSRCRDRWHLPLGIFSSLSLEDGCFFNRIVDNCQGTVKHSVRYLQAYLGIADYIFNPLSAAIRGHIQIAVIYGAPNRHRMRQQKLGLGLNLDLWNLVRERPVGNLGRDALAL